MIQPKRFEVQLHEMGASIFPHYAGRFVEYSDYAALAAENERLRKAGDALFESVKYHRINSLIDDRSEVAWLSAKEGRDAK